MNRSIFLAGAMVLSLTACVVPPVGSAGGGGKEFNPAGIQPPTLCEVVVFVLLRQIVVNQEPAITLPCVGEGPTKTVVSFHLDPAAATTFPLTNAIVFKPNPPANPICKTDTSRQKVKCSFDRPTTPTTYKYSVTVDGVGTLDPSVFAN